ncbi:MAG: response regulator [Pyrinomonadaceae bacterium]|nr:response regulator [Pyrinomonadaceae bacterium]MCX7639057.1 response regulator [Pyrinomonadaceae bacterium]MDW8303722.1 response regulator [Acidobacteriota bacterium]
MSSKFLETFVTEARFYLSKIRSSLLSYKQDAETAHLRQALEHCNQIRSSVPLVDGFDSFTEWINSLYESLERIASGAAVSEVNQIVEEIERFEVEIIEGYFQKISSEGHSKLSETENSGIDEEMLEIFSSEAEEHFQNIEKNLSLLKENPENSKALSEIRRSFHTIKGSAGIVGLGTLSEIAHKSEDLLDYLTQKPERLNEQVFQILYSVLTCMEALCFGEVSTQTRRRVEELEEQISKVKAEELEKVHISSVFADDAGLKISEAPKSVIRVSLEKLDDLAGLAHELMVVNSFLEDQILRIRQQIEELKENSNRFSRLSSRIETDFSSVEKGVRTALKQEFDVLELDRYTEFHQTSLELAETASDTNTIASELMTLASEIDYTFTAHQRLFKEITDKILRLKMIPFSTLSQRLHRTVQVTAAEEGKSVEFFIEDKGLEIDSEILHSIAEPLLHLLRNAVSHGIEKPEVRESLGKNRVGRVSLSVSKEDAHISFTVKDDGRGIDIEELKKRAIERGILSSEQVEKMSLEEVLNLIFIPGLSTVSKISEISGRGIGMEVVKACVDRFKGTIKIKSEQSKGTTFIIRLPLSLNAAKVIPVKFDEKIIAFPIKIIKGVTTVSREDFEAAKTLEKLNLKNKVYKPLYLSEVLGFVADEHKEKEIFVILVEGQKEKYALAVNKILKPEEVIIKPPKGLLKNVKYLLGACVLSNGQVMPVLDLIGLAEDFSPSKETTEKLIRKQVTIMIIDDSPSVRKVNEKIIRKIGWKVLTAKDGLEALEILEAASDDLPDVILTDIEMPRMDGYEFLAALKKNEKFRMIPVLIITSRTSEKHRQKAFELGASSYITKPFDQKILMEKVRQLIE